MYSVVKVVAVSVAAGSNRMQVDVFGRSHGCRAGRVVQWMTIVFLP